MEGLKQLRYLSKQNNLIVKTDTKVCKVSMRVLVFMFVLVWACPQDLDQAFRNSYVNSTGNKHSVGD